MPSESAARVLSIADEYVHAYFEQYPEEAAGSGYPDAPLDRLGDQSPEARSAWEAREDGWLAALAAIDAGELAGGDAAVPYAVLRERLESSVERRRYRPELWNVSPAWGWCFALPVVFSRQPVGSPSARRDALARAGDLPRYLDSEVEALREGMAEGFTATRENVAAVVEQVDALLAESPQASPFFDPALRDEDPDFRGALGAVLTSQVWPALARYKRFLSEEYLPREGSAGVAALPCGEAGYQAAVRYHTTISPPAREIHATGLREMEAVQRQMREIARRSFATEDLPGLLRELQSEPRFTFLSADEVLATTRAAVARARDALPAWFGRIPTSEVTVRPFPAFQERTGGGLYSAAASDGSYPATYELGTHEPARLSRATVEATAFHETWPGHHLQIALATEGDGLHPIVRFLFSSGFVEGWALYTERLAEEMGLYTSDLDRLGLLSNEAMRAARLVVDPGLHVLGWSRQQAIDYMTSHTAESEEAVTYEVDRYLAGPGQAVSYLLGRIEIGRLRQRAEARLGARFDIRAFHDRLLEDGSVTLPLLSQKVERWIEAGG